MDTFEIANDILFLDPSLSLAGLWRADGAGTGVAVRVVMTHPDEEQGWRETRLVVGTVILEVRMSDVAALAMGDTLEVDGTLYEVLGDPRRDDQHLTWLAEARPQ